ncbi:MAG: bifunctional phosphoglucose/phosphomannose isomerase [Sulfolobales archaeon]|nr:bifunctional phosphoglucose/phosphomannose isomerase [Sulfolobales archaeon]
MTLSEGNVYERWPEFYENALSFEVPDVKAEKLVYLGIGGSGIPGRLLEMMDLPFEFRLFRGYRATADERTLAISVSYSGTTAETLVATRRVHEMGAKVIVITSGGDLLKWAKERGVPYVQIPSGLQTRFSFPYVFVPIVKILRNLGVNYNPIELLEATRDSMETARKEAERLANELGERVPVFYASKYLAIAERFKQEFNENAKYPAFYGEIPEVNHNEIELYSRWSDYLPVVIKSDDPIDNTTANVLNAKVLEPPYRSLLKTIAYFFLLAGLASVYFGSKMGVKADVLYNIPKVRQLTRRLLLNE